MTPATPKQTTLNIMNFKALAAAALAATSILTFAPAAAEARSLSASQAMQLCMAAKEANNMGLSAKPMLQQVFISKGAPAYLANVAMNEMKEYCPRVY